MFTTLFDATAKIDDTSSKKKTRRIDNFMAPQIRGQISGNEDIFSRQSFQLCSRLRSRLASSHLASDNSQRDEVSRCCSASVFVIQCRGREVAPEFATANPSRPYGGRISTFMPRSDLFPKFSANCNRQLK